MKYSFRKLFAILLGQFTRNFNHDKKKKENVCNMRERNLKRKNYIIILHVRSFDRLL